MSGPFTDADIAHYLKVVQTQRGIIEYAEAMAQVLAEAGRASSLAVGDSPEMAVRCWSDVIRDRALELLREGERCEPQSRTRRLTSRSTSTE